MVSGLLNKQVGGGLGMAEKTVKNYVSNLLAKLGMSRRTEAVEVAYEDVTDEITLVKFKLA